MGDSPTPAEELSGIAENVRLEFNTDVIYHGNDGCDRETHSTAEAQPSAVWVIRHILNERNAHCVTHIVFRLHGPEKTTLEYGPEPEHTKFYIV